ncbi:trace amine-associated receptor 13c-like [Actinia tenebrosa]|uniref:Trace amine-associated receptor 13c-like n=1 Tax=Actinia tenebrosa TaxID=6105 RepID=A0A6P8IUY7_ACTTE|nr:trace amine-associated receptor 13c-like [Actinia tenebrosa]
MAKTNHMTDNSYHKKPRLKINLISSCARNIDFFTMGFSIITNETKSTPNSTPCLFLEVFLFNKNDGTLYITTILTLALNAVFGIVATVGNFIFILSLWKTNSLQNPSNFLLGNLAISDLLVGLVVQPMYVAYKAAELNGTYVCFVHVSFSTSAWLAVGVSFLTLANISLERYVAISRPFLYLKIISKRNVVALSVSIWLFSFGLVFSRFAGISTFHFHAVCSLIIVISFTTTTFFYIKIFRLAKRHQKSIIEAHKNNATKNIVQERKLTKTISLVTGLFFLSYVPTLCIMVYYSVRGYGLVVKTIYSWTDTALFVNSSWNPFIYYIRNQEIRLTMLKMLKKKEVCSQKSRIPAVSLSFARKAGIIKISKNPNKEIPNALS